MGKGNWRIGRIGGCYVRDGKIRGESGVGVMRDGVDGVLGLDEFVCVGDGCGVEDSCCGWC